MIDRIFKNWKTTLIGVVVLIFGGALIWTGKTTLIEASPTILGLLGFFTKDKPDEQRKAVKQAVKELKEEVKQAKEKHDEKHNDIVCATKRDLERELSEFRDRQRKD